MVKAQMNSKKRKFICRESDTLLDACLWINRCFCALTTQILSSERDLVKLNQNEVTFRFVWCLSWQQLNKLHLLADWFWHIFHYLQMPFLMQSYLTVLHGIKNGVLAVDLITNNPEKILQMIKFCLVNKVYLITQRTFVWVVRCFFRLIFNADINLFSSISLIQLIWWDYHIECIHEKDFNIGGNILDIYLWDG